MVTPSILHSLKQSIRVSVSVCSILLKFVDLTVPILGAGLTDNATTARTLWPLDGGSVNVTLHDSAAYIFINIGLGVNTTNFNITLFSQPLNETGAGNLCFPKLVLPPDLQVEDGTQASIQFATTGSNGEGLYNVRTLIAGGDESTNCQNSAPILLSAKTLQSYQPTNVRTVQL